MTGGVVTETANGRAGALAVGNDGNGHRGLQACAQRTQLQMGCRDPHTTRLDGTTTGGSLFVLRCCWLVPAGGCVIGPLSVARRARGGGTGAVYRVQCNAPAASLGAALIKA